MWQTGGKQHFYNKMYLVDVRVLLRIRDFVMTVMDL
jgi:hypothetical protein